MLSHPTPLALQRRRTRSTNLMRTICPFEAHQKHIRCASKTFLKRIRCSTPPARSCRSNPTCVAADKLNRASRLVRPHDLLVGIEEFNPPIPPSSSWRSSFGDRDQNVAKGMRDSQDCMSHWTSASLTLLGGRRKWPVIECEKRSLSSLTPEPMLCMTRGVPSGARALLTTMICGRSPPG